MTPGSLEELLGAVKEGPAIRSKGRAGAWARPFVRRAGLREGVLGPGDDAGAVETPAGYLLLAAEGMRSPLFEDPEFAGFCSVTVNVNDIYAMGGRPFGIVAVVFEGDAGEETRAAFTRGMEAALDHYGLPMLGGHTSTDPGPFRVATCIAGRAERLLRGDGAGPGDDLLVAVDLDGRARERFHAWDTVTRAEPSRTGAKLEALVRVSEIGGARACRDISNAGILGTLAMMMEASGTGAHVDLEGLPVPEGIDLGWWLGAYPSCGFLLAVPPGDPHRVAELFASCGVACGKLGRVVAGSRLTVSLAGESAEFIDWRVTPVTGMY